MIESFRNRPLYSSCLVLIIALAVFFRIYHFPQRVDVQADNSRDVQVARFAADNHLLPQIGQFSSAGPFFYGPWYYWFLEAESFLPLGPLTHWYVQSLLSFLFIFLIYKLGKMASGEKLGLTAAFLAAISPAQVSNSFSVWNPAIIPILVLAALIFLTRYFQARRKSDLFFLAFFVSLAATIHFQAILIIPTLLIPIALILKFKPKPPTFLKEITPLAIGIIIPLLPLIYFDFHHYWYNATSIFIYLAVDQYSIWVPNRWLTYLTDYWPRTWASIFGANKSIGTLLTATTAILTAKEFLSKKRNPLSLIVIFAFLLEIFVYRYYRGNRFEYYSFFAHPSVLILTAWAIYQLFKINRLIGLSLLVIVSYFSLSSSFAQLERKGVTYDKIKTVKAEIYAAYPRQDYAVYGCHDNTGSISQPLALFMYYDKKDKIDGFKIGVCERNGQISWQPLEDSQVTPEKTDWYNMTTEEVYNHTVNWWRQKPPQKGNLWQFIREKFSPRCYPHC